MKEGDSVDVVWRLRLGGERNNEAGSENDAPDQPHASGSLAEGHDGTKVLWPAAAKVTRISAGLKKAGKVSTNETGKFFKSLGDGIADMGQKLSS